MRLRLVDRLVYLIILQSLSALSLDALPVF